MTGKTHTPETVSKMSDSQQLVDRSGANNHMYGRSGENHPMYGKSHSDETRAKMSGANNPMFGRTGANHPKFGITPTNAFQSGANNPMYGRTGANHPMFGRTNGMTIYVYSLDGTLINSFSSQVATAEWLSVNHSTISRYIKSGKVWNNKYSFRKS